MIANIAGVKAPFSPALRRYPAIIIAPTAPMAPAWLTVATPNMIEPNTANIRTSGGTRTRATWRINLKSYLPSKVTGGATFGRMSAVISI